MKSKILVAALFSTLVVVSCSKDDDKKKEEPTPTPTPTTPTASTPQPTFASGNGSLIAINSVSTSSSIIGPIETTIGTAVAVFYDSPTSTTFLDAGKVEVNSSKLKQNTNNSYAFIPSVTNPNGLDFDSGVEWVVEGATHVSGFTFYLDNTFPKVNQITSGDTVTKSTGYTLSNNGILFSDSVIFQIGEILRVEPANTVNHTFTASDLAGLKGEKTIVQIAAYTATQSFAGIKAYNIVKETVVSKIVTVE